MTLKRGTIKFIHIRCKRDFDAIMINFMHNSISDAIMINFMHNSISINIFLSQCHMHSYYSKVYLRYFFGMEKLEGGGGKKRKKPTHAKRYEKEQKHTIQWHET